jgi:hypothetical protein
VASPDETALQRSEPDRVLSADGDPEASGMRKSLWALPDAIVVATRLTGLLPTRAAKGVEHTTHRWPISCMSAVPGKRRPNNRL